MMWFCIALAAIAIGALIIFAASVRTGTLADQGVSVPDAFNRDVSRDLEMSRRIIILPAPPGPLDENEGDGYGESYVP